MLSHFRNKRLVCLQQCYSTLTALQNHLGSKCPSTKATPRPIMSQSLGDFFYPQNVHPGVRTSGSALTFTDIISKCPAPLALKITSI